MDLLSHALVGGLVASIGLQKKYGLVASATMVAANLIPDMDSAVMVMGPRYFLQYHRHPLTHSVGGAILLSTALTTFVYLATPLKKPGLVFSIAFVGMMLHLLSDLLTPWPIPLLWPITSRTHSFDLINFLDPFLLVLLGTSFLAVRRWPERETWVVILALIIAGCYLGFRSYGQQVAVNLVREKSSMSKIAALPHGLSLIVWDVITQDISGYNYYVVDSLRKKIRSGQVIQSEGDKRVIETSRRSTLVQAFLRRARFPYTLVMEQGNSTTVEWRDVHLLISGGAFRGVKVEINEHGDIVEERFELRTR